MAKQTASDEPMINVFKALTIGAPLPTDNLEVAKRVLNDLMKQMKERHILFDISDLPLTTPAEVNIARRRLEEILSKTNEIIYAADQKNKWKEISDYFNIHTPKTEAGRRSVPMLDFVKEAFLEEKRRQEEEGTKCLVRVDGYTDFIFINRFGMLQHQSTLNKAIRRITRDCNDAVLRKNPNAKVLLPHFSCHSLRHTFTTRMCEAGVNVKVIQDTLGHADISTTLNIYADVTKDLKKAEFEGLDKWFAKSMGQKNGDKNTGPETGDREEGDS